MNTSTKHGLSAILLTLTLGACAPQQSQDFASLTCATGEDCSQVDLDNAAEKTEHDEAAGLPTTEALAIQWQESLKPLQMKTSVRTSFVLPPEWQHLDPQKVIPARPFEMAMTFFLKHKDKIKNQQVIGIIDFTQKSNTKRLYLLNLKTGTVERLLVAHGKNSDTDHDGYATKFSNIEGSLMSSLGAYLTAETYSGKYGLSLRLDGLESSNSLARKRAVVMHSADYVSPKRSVLGRSYGCPAIEPAARTKTINLIKNGALLYAWYNQ